jgi:dienelactone hydrolase
VINLARPRSEDGVTEYDFKLSVADNEVPGVIWAPEGKIGERPLILMGHGRAQHKKTGMITCLATSFARHLGYAALAIDAPDHGERISREEATRIAKQVGERVRSAGRASEPTPEMVRSMAERARRAVPEWQAALDAALSLDCIGNTFRIGYWGLSMGTSIGISLVASEPRIKCAVFGLSGLRPGSEELEAAARAITIPLQFTFQWNDAIASREHGLALFDALGSEEKTMHINMGGHVEVPDFEAAAWGSFFLRNLGAPRGCDIDTDAQ